MRGEFYQQLTNDLETARAEGLFKEERIITSAQQADITVADGSHVINFCANNYLGLANHPDLIAAAKAGMDSHGFGMASVRFICGTQDSHKELEQKLAAFLGMEDAILYSSCFDANGGLFETLLGAEDAIISDALNHASIIDGVRLCKAKRYRYANNDMNRPGFPGECFICELRLPDHRFRWKHNKLFLLLPEEYGPAFPAIVDCYTSPPTLVWPVPLLHGFSSSYGVLPPLCKDH